MALILACTYKANMSHDFLLVINSNCDPIIASFHQHCGTEAQNQLVLH